MVLGLVDGEHRPVPELRAEPGHRLGQVGGRHHHLDTGNLFGASRVDAADASVGAGKGDQLHVQGVHELDVAHVLVGTGDARQTADALGRSPDLSAHRSLAAAAASTASVIW